MERTNNREYQSTPNPISDLCAKKHIIKYYNSLHHTKTAQLSEQYERSEMKNVKKEQISNVERRKTKTYRKIDPEEYETREDLFAAIKYWWVKRYRKGETSWIRYQRLLESMAEHDIYPIDIFDPKPDQVVAQLDFIEDRWKAKRTDKQDYSGTWAVINRWKAVKGLMRSYGRIEETKNEWNYTPPDVPKPKPRQIPSPGTVHKLTHFKYSTDRYETKLYQYMCFFSFFCGFRPNSEMSILKVDDFDSELGELVFYQPKVKAWRTKILPQRVIKSKNTKNITNWLDKWRPQVENQYSKDYMFLQPSGKPFTGDFLTKKLREMFIPVYDSYYPYCSRHWYATASLINTRLEHGVYGLMEVCDDMHHSSETVTKGYVRTANKWFKKAPYDWFAALLKYTKSTVKEGKTSTFEKIGCTGNSPPVREYGPAEDYTLFLLLKKPVLFANQYLLQKQLSTFLSLFFFYSVYKTLIKNIRVNARNTDASPNFFAVLAIHIGGG